MATSHVAVKLNRFLVEEARHQAAALSRSVPAQREHRMRLGRDVEANDVLTHSHARALLTVPEARDSRATAQADTAFEAIIGFYRHPPPWVDDAEREIGSRPGAVGRDGNGVLVRIGEDGEPHPI